MTTKPLQEPLEKFDEIVGKELSLKLPHFTYEDAFTIGTSIRTRLREISPRKGAAVNIALANSNQLLFHAVSGPGVTPDGDDWIARKRKTVLRWGTSTWAMRSKYDGDEKAFAAKFMLGEAAGDFAIHGGGFPVRVKGVEGVLAVIVVSGLTQPEDHQVIVEALEEFLASNS